MSYKVSESWQNPLSSHWLMSHKPYWSPVLDRNTLTEFRASQVGQTGAAAPLLLWLAHLLSLLVRSLSPQVQQHTMMSSPSPVQVQTPQSMPPPPQPSPQPPTSQPNSARCDRRSPEKPQIRQTDGDFKMFAAFCLQLRSHSVPGRFPAQPVPSALTEPRHRPDPPELRSPLTWTAQHSRYTHHLNSVRLAPVLNRAATNDYFGWSIDSFFD